VPKSQNLMYKITHAVYSVLRIYFSIFPELGFLTYCSAAARKY